MSQKYIKHTLFFVFSLSFILVFLLFVPFYSIFSFEEKWSGNILKTEFSFEELTEINELLAQIDEEKISDLNLKNNLLSLKKNFSEQSDFLIIEQEKAKKLEEERLELERLEKEKKEEEERKKLEEIEKSRVYPLEFDITSKMAKLHIQERNLSCEAAATTDILSTILKTDIAEKDILAKMKKDVTYGKASYINSEWKLIWWDPNNWFVWEMDGHQYNLTWYAIYEKPMSEIYDDYGVKVATYNKFENNLWLNSTREALSYMLKELVKWNYVQMWWDYCTDPNFEDGNIDRKISTEESNSGLSQKNFCYSFYQERMVTWYTEEWKEIKAWKQSHNFVLLGYIWDIENPEKIIIRDTQTWRHIYPTDERLRKWELNDARAIIVYNEIEKD